MMPLLHVMNPVDRDLHSTMKEHYKSWSWHIRNDMWFYPDSWKGVLQDFRFALKAKDKASIPFLARQGKNKGQPMATSAEVLEASVPWAEVKHFLAKEFIRYFAFYNCEYRLASPNSHPITDFWHKGEDINVDNAMLDNYKYDEWFVGKYDISGERMGDSKEVDWQRWDSNSMLLPRHERKRGRPRYFIRQPTTITLPGFVWLLGQQYTGKEILAAWNLMPVVRGNITNGSRRPGTAENTSR